MWWHILQVEPTDDEKTIKKAYSKIIKEVDQDKEIETFTKVHHAFRMAMKSFKKNNNHKSSLAMYEGEAGWYLSELKTLYDDSEKRLDSMAWKNLFACMSFKEEKEFQNAHIDFFNQHYGLTEEIWKMIDTYYPLSHMKDFHWPELLSGDCCITSMEIEGMPSIEAIVYIESKIKGFYALLDRRYEDGLILFKPYLTKTNTFDMKYWTLKATIGYETTAKIKETYESLKEYENESYDLSYAYSIYLNGIKDYKTADETMSSIPENQLLPPMRLLINEIKGNLTHSFSEELLNQPWLELMWLDNKLIKQLSKGMYDKVTTKHSGKKDFKSLRLGGKRHD